jgi:hypothetical protein
VPGAQRPSALERIFEDTAMEVLDRAPGRQTPGQTRHGKFAGTRTLHQVENEHGRSLTFRVGIRGQDQLAQITSPNAPLQRLQGEVAGFGSIGRIQSPHQDVIPPPEGARSLQRLDVTRLFDDADLRSIPPCIRAEKAWIRFGYVAADPTALRLGHSPIDCSREFARLGISKNVKRQTLGTAPPDPGEALECLDQSFDGRRVGHGSMGARGGVPEDAGLGGDSCLENAWQV